MKIAFLLPSMRRAGAESVVANLSRGCAKAGHEVHLVIVGGLFEYKEELENTSVQIHCLNLYEGLIRYYQQLLRRRIKNRLVDFFIRLRPDILHCHLSHSLIMAGPAIKKCGLRTIYTFHGIEPAFTRNDWISRWRSYELIRTIKSTHCSLLAVSSEAARSAEKGLGLSAGSIAIQPNPIDLDYWKPLSNIKEQPLPTAIMVGTLYPLKMVHIGIQAIKKINSHLNFALTIVGDGTERSNLEKLSHALAIEDRVEFLGVRRDVRKLLQEVGVMWLLSEREGMPIAVLEAMAVGLPVIATNVSGTRELIEDGKNGILVPIGDAQAVANATLQLWKDEDLRERIIREGRDSVKRYSLDIIVKQHVERYYEALC
ncbi:MAG: glycosyltransferase [Nitrospirota bacterium]